MWPLRRWLFLAASGLVGCGSGPVPAPPSPSPETSSPVTPADAPAQAAATPVDLEAQARAAWAGRADKAAIARAIDSWRRIAEEQRNDPRPLLALARAYGTLADYHLRAATETGQRADALERAIDAAERGLLVSSAGFAAGVARGLSIDEAVKLVEPDKVAALAVYGTSLARYAVDKGFTALLMYRGRIVAAMQRVIDVDPKTGHAAADRELGAFYARVPGFAGGDLPRSRTHFDKALELAPEALETRLRYAETYAAVTKNRELFARLLAEVASADAGDADIAPDNLLVKQRAALLAAAIDDLFAR